MECRIISLPQLDNMPLRQVGQYLDSHVEHEVIGCVNWCNDFPYKPYSTFVIAVSATRLYVFFSVISKDLRAVNTVDLSPVADDSCVEFFMQLPGNEEYWNFEFNCIGTLNASHRVERTNPTRLTPEELASIQRYASCGTEPIEEQEGTYCWDLTVSIPLELIGLDGNKLPDFIKGNFYKCAGQTANRHYVSWSPIDSDKPDFHRPDCFGTLWLRKPEQDTIPENTKSQARSTVKPSPLKRFLLRLLGKKQTEIKC